MVTFAVHLRCSGGGYVSRKRLKCLKVLPVESFFLENVINHRRDAVTWFGDCEL